MTKTMENQAEALPDSKQIIKELSNTIMILGGKSDILSIIGSLDDTMTATEVLQDIKAYNKRTLDLAHSELSKILEFYNTQD